MYFELGVGTGGDLRSRRAGRCEVSSFPIGGSRRDLETSESRVYGSVEVTFGAALATVFPHLLSPFHKDIVYIAPSNLLRMF
jgi:hypothetical protein